MSHINGLGSLQQGVAPAAPSETNPIRPAGPKDEASEGTVANVEHGDQAELSSAGGLVAQALASSDVRTAKVGALQQAIAAGNYSVSSSDVADKIIQSLLR
ncbi:MAG: flagellar biosynthesis anti-sigma factor FlgM [Edaphobacter sp.]